MPRLSVLMPARNAERTIGEALRSTLRDLPRDAELIVLDDASSDRTLEIASSTGDSRVKIDSVTENLGVALAAERLLEAASGELIARMDSDDVCLPGRFRSEIGAIDRGADIVFSMFQVIGANRPKLIPPIRFGAAAAQLALLIDCPYPHSTSLGRAEVLLAAGGYREGAIAEDYDLWLRAAANGANMVRLGRPTVLIRKSATQVTAAVGWRESLAYDPVLERSYQELTNVVWGTRETPWFRDLAFTRAGPLSAEGRAAVEPFVQRFLGSLSGLSPLEHWYLGRRARQELGWRSR
ncbi:MAG: glycosyltransferase family 2 protein [Salinibacterium sp.]|nr:glycosyltransferase family 2 protein [Salinibacterium sp.]